MFKKKRCIILTDMEYRSLVRIMVDCRNKFLGIKKPTSDIDEILLKIIDTQKHRVRR